MRIFVAVPDQTGNKRKTRLTLVDCNSTNDLLKRIYSVCNIQPHFVIAKLKQQMINIRIIEGWPLDIYPLRQGSEIVVQILPEGWKNISPQSSPRVSKLGKIEEESELEIQDANTNNTTAQPDQKLSFYSDQLDWTKYFDESLEQFLNAVRNKSIEQASNILKSEPECSDEKLLTKLLYKKSIFLLNQTGQNGRAAIHEAVQQKDLDMVQFLLIKSSDPNIVSLDQYTPLQLAIILGSLSIFETLVSHPKIDINKITNKGTALHVAVQQQKLNYAQKLVKAGADPTIQNKYGESVFKLCQKLKIKNLKLKSPQNTIVQTPYILRGIVYKVSSFASRLKQRLLVSNPFKDQILIYEDEDIQQKITISKLSSVTVVKEKSWGMKKQYFYFQIKGASVDITFCVKNVRIGAQWIQDLSKCIKYCKAKSSQKIIISVEEQLIQILDDGNNVIKLHKRKVNPQPVKNQITKVDRMSIFDLKPVQQNKIQQKPIVIFDDSNGKIDIDILGEKNVQSVIMTGESSINPIYGLPVESQQPNYLRQSELLGSVIGNELLLGSLRKRSQSFRQSSMIFNEEKIEPMVCYKDFEILRQLGNGSFGKVFLARHKKQQKLYALKVLNKKKLMAKKQLKYAVGEANILKKVDSPFIIKLYYSFQTPSNLYIAIDYCPNGDLSEILTQEDKLSQRSCKFYIAQLILAIEYLHQQKIIYRDLKPQNILIAQDGYIRLTDFNLSKQNNFSMSFCGSPAYLSPEMLQKKGVGFEADIYGIGCVLYEMLVGQPPFFDDDLETLYQNIRKGKLKFPSGISKSAKSLISGLLQKDINKRIGIKTMNQIKNHDFFHSFDWKSLQKQQMKKPMELENKFQDKTMGLEVIKEHGFQDSDYQSNSSMINRIKNFTFVRQE